MTDLTRETAKTFNGAQMRWLDKHSWGPFYYVRGETITESRLTMDHFVIGVSMFNCAITLNLVKAS